MPQLFIEILSFKTTDSAEVAIIHSHAIMSNEKIHFLDVASSLPGTRHTSPHMVANPRPRLPPILVPEHAQDPAPTQRQTDPIYGTIRLVPRYRTAPRVIWRPAESQGDAVYPSGDLSRLGAGHDDGFHRDRTTP